MATKILNLDNIKPAHTRVVQLFGEKHEVLDMTVENFIATSDDAQKMKELPLHEQMKATVEMICRSIPSAPAERLSKMSLEQLAVITAFIRGDDMDAIETQEDGSGN